MECASALLLVLGGVMVMCLGLLPAVRKLPWAGRLGPEPRDPTRCSRCGYDLRGLDGAARCPECGVSGAEREVPLRLVVQPDRLSNVWLVVLLWMVTLILLRPMSMLGLVGGYLRDGFSFSTAWRVIPLRELSRDFADVSLMWEWAAAAFLVAPLCVGVRPRPARWLILGSWTAGLVVCVLRLVFARP